MDGRYLLCKIKPQAGGRIKKGWCCRLKFPVGTEMFQFVGHCRQESSAQAPSMMRGRSSSTGHHVPDGELSRVAIRSPPGAFDGAHRQRWLPALVDNRRAHQAPNEPTLSSVKVPPCVSSGFSFVLRAGRPGCYLFGQSHEVELVAF